MFVNLAGRPELNGKAGEILGPEADGRFPVRYDAYPLHPETDGRVCIRVRPANLVPMPDGGPPDVPLL